MSLALIFESAGFGEWLVLLAVALIVIGPKRLPEAARKFGQNYAKFRRAAENFKRQLLDADTQIGQSVREVQRELQAVENAVQREINEVSEMNIKSSDENSEPTGESKADGT
jgi:Tat protein translocase TatB subunit